MFVIRHVLHVKLLPVPAIEGPACVARQVTSWQRQVLLHVESAVLAFSLSLGQASALSVQLAQQQRQLAVKTAMVG